MHMRKALRARTRSSLSFVRPLRISQAASGRKHVLRGEHMKGTAAITEELPVKRQFIRQDAHCFFGSDAIGDAGSAHSLPV